MRNSSKPAYFIILMWAIIFAAKYFGISFPDLGPIISNFLGG